MKKEKLKKKKDEQSAWMTNMRTPIYKKTLVKLKVAVNTDTPTQHESSSWTTSPWQSGCRSLVSLWQATAHSLHVYIRFAPFQTPWPGCFASWAGLHCTWLLRRTVPPLTTWWPMPKLLSIKPKSILEKASLRTTSYSVNSKPMELICYGTNWCLP